MFFVPDGTQIAGMYECSECGERFLSTTVYPKIVCPYCGEYPDMEIGPDDVMEASSETAILTKVVEGAEEVEKYDILLSLAVTGGDYEWI